MNLFFPELKCALVVRRKAPKEARFVTGLGDQSVYLISADKPPKGAEIAQGVTGGWNFPDGVCVVIVFGPTHSALSRYRWKEAGDWLVFPRQLADGRWCGLLKTFTSIDFGIACTPVVIK